MKEKQHHDFQVARNELKYYVSYSEYLIISNMLKKFMQEDRHNKSGKGYFVRSLYFDTLSDKSYEEKVAGIEERAKYRLRIYDFKGKSAKFEIKNKRNNFTMKDTAIISRKDAIRIQNGDYEAMLEYKDRILNKAYMEFKKQSYRPVVMIDYERHAFVADYNEIRIVFDKFLKSTASCFDIYDKKAFPTKKLKSGLVILEIKFNHFIPDFIKEVLQIPASERSAVSKYSIGRLDNFDAIT